MSVRVNPGDTHRQATEQLGRMLGPPEGAPQRAPGIAPRLGLKDPSDAVRPDLGFDTGRPQRHHGDDP